MPRRITRRRLLAGAGIGAAGIASAGVALDRLGGRDESRGGPRDVLLIVIDTLRADHLGAYGAAEMHTPNIDALAGQGIRFTRTYPEAMPTMPMRRTIMTGRRIFPFRRWRPWAGVGGSPGWGPIMPGTRTLVNEFEAAGYATVYVTDNPFIGFAEALGPFRESVNRLVPIPGHTGMVRPTSSLPDDDAHRVLPAYLREQPDQVARMRDYLAENGGPPAACSGQRSRSCAGWRGLGSAAGRADRSSWSSTRSTRTSHGSRRASTGRSTAIPTCRSSATSPTATRPA